MVNLAADKWKLAPGAMDELKAIDVKSCDSIHEVMKKVRSGKLK